MGAFTGTCNDLSKGCGTLILPSWMAFISSHSEHIDYCLFVSFSRGYPSTHIRLKSLAPASS